MPSDCCSAHLKIWREIVSEIHRCPKPGEQQLDRIGNRFEELDSGRFMWSKESILSVFRELSLPEAPHNSFSSVNEVLDQEHEISLVGVKDDIHIARLEHTFRPLGLMDLPMEVFDMILETLDSIAKLESWILDEKKYDALVKISGPSDREAYKTYLHRNSPILNSIQTFSLTSRKINHLCRGESSSSQVVHTGSLPNHNQPFIPNARNYSFLLLSQHQLSYGPKISSLNKAAMSNRYCSNFLKIVVDLLVNLQNTSPSTIIFSLNTILHTENPSKRYNFSLQRV